MLQLLRAARIKKHALNVAMMQGQEKDEAILEGLWILHDQGEVRQNLLEKLMKSSDHRIRAAATHLVRFQATQLKSPLALLRKMTRDPHPRVRTEVIHVVSHLQQGDQAYAALLGQIDVSGNKDLQTILKDASYGVSSGMGPEIPVLQKPEDSKLSHWLLKEDGKEERGEGDGKRNEKQVEQRGSKISRFQDSRFQNLEISKS